MAGGRILESSLMLARVLDNVMGEGEHGRRPKTSKKRHAHPHYVTSSMPLICFLMFSGLLFCISYHCVTDRSYSMRLVVLGRRPKALRKMAACHLGRQPKALRKMAYIAAVCHLA